MQQGGMRRKKFRLKRGLKGKTGGKLKAFEATRTALEKIF